MPLAKDRRRVIILLAVGATCVAAAALAWQWKERRVNRLRTYTIGYDHNPPNQVVLADGSPGGIAVDAVREAAERAGVRLRWVRVSQDPDVALEGRVVDLWPLMTILPERRKRVHLTDPWLESTACLVVPDHSPIRQPRDAAGVRLAHLALPFHRKRAAEYWHPKEQIVLAEPAAVMRAVCDGTAEAGYLKEHAAIMALLSGGSCAKGPLRMIAVPDLTSLLAVASTRAAAPAADAIRNEITQLAHEGRLTDILNQWTYFAPQSIRSLNDLADARETATRLKAIAVAVTLVLFGAIWQAFRLRQARQAAERASQSKSEFLATVSHEIRTPMSGVIGLTRMLGDSGLTGEQTELVGSIKQCAESLLSIVDAVLDLSKVEAGKLELERTVFSPRETVREVLRLLESRASEKGIELTVEIEDNVPDSVFGDPLRLRQVLFNLTGNALKFTEHGSIKVRSGIDRQDHNRVELWFEVRDTGIGIPPEAISRLFRPYVQAGGTVSRRLGGFGLGLAISRRLVEAMGGSITVSSKPGRGSVFWFVIPFPLPVRQPEPEVIEESGEAASPLCPLRVLVAEDNVINQRVTKYMLGKLGHQFHLASNGLEAVQSWQREEFDVILMDCQMPEMDGFEATRQIRTAEAGGARRRTPIIAMTANAMQKDREACLAAGMDDHLGKPVELPALAEALSRWAPHPAEPRPVRH